MPAGWSTTTASVVVPASGIAAVDGLKESVAAGFGVCAAALPGQSSGMKASASSAGNCRTALR